VASALARYRPLHHIAPPGTLDGGDVLRVGRTLYVGRTPRSNPEGIRQLAAIAANAGYDTRPVAVSGCLHLKSAVTVLADNLLLLNPAWVDAAGFPSDVLLIDPAEPFAANALRIGHTILHAAEFPATRARIEASGFTVLPVSAGELAKAEGGVTCCSILLL
jgi:dimethylargininase